ncbi:MAG: hypothetical protein H0X65_19030 [Gemmatimonadetes bacterium]|nr:hypothetical protein [Gemmatimonadota bacterium]
MSTGPALVDIHNHLIPGVDDGARSMDEAMAALAAMHEQGVRRLAATPHLDAELTHRPQALHERLARIDAAWESFRAAAVERFPDVEIARGNEIMLDVPRVVLTDARVRLGGGTAVLVEFPRLFVPAGSTDALYRIQLEGYRAVVAHPERYVNVGSSDLSLVDQWCRTGAVMAVNAGSLMGGFGPAAQSTAREMLRRGWAHVIGSDYHARAGRRPLLLRAAYDDLVRVGGEEQARLLLSVNPGRLMDGEAPIAVPPLPVGVWSRLRAIFKR